MLEATHLQCTRGLRTLFSDLDFTVGRGELVHVAGANGSGKTSLVRILCGLLEPTAGIVRWDGVDIRELAEDYRGRLVYIGHAHGVKDELTPAENLRVACTFAGLDADASAVAGALASLGLERAAHVPVKSLSQGQRRRAALARLELSSGRMLWLLDEPFIALDAEAAARIEQLIGEHLDRGGMVVMTTHQPLPAFGPAMRSIELA
jgi:heme exporter protein A